MVIESISDELESSLTFRKLPVFLQALLDHVAGVSQCAVSRNTDMLTCSFFGLLGRIKLT